MKRFKQWMAAAFVLSAAALGTPAQAYEYKFQCYTKELDPRVEISGTFEMVPDDLRGEGQVEVKSAAIEGDLFPAVTFYRGMWTTDRMNFHLRNEAGEQLAVVVVEDFFENDRFALKVRDGAMQGAYGNSPLTCYNRSCGECFNEPYPTDHCRDVCGCTSPFCGAW